MYSGEAIMRWMRRGLVARRYRGLLLEGSPYQIWQSSKSHGAGRAQFHQTYCLGFANAEHIYTIYQ
ncbi:hypothetical protein C8029_18990 [Roseobacter sp. TSBP12]|nr:hypothetical protein C8029_18990 [Roseobacter sp. TSBP12]